jgi:hypothetical protein
MMKTMMVIVMTLKKNSTVMMMIGTTMMKTGTTMMNAGSWITSWVKTAWKKLMSKV